MDKSTDESEAFAFLKFPQHGENICSGQISPPEAEEVVNLRFIQENLLSS